jgi:hypothetical protein
LEVEAHPPFWCKASYSSQSAERNADKQVPASAILAGSPRAHPGHWSIHPIIAEIQDIIQGKNYIVHKIHIEANKIADSLPKKARRASILNSSLFCCQALAHHPTCKVKLVLQNNDWGNMIPIFVTCL